MASLNKVLIIGRLGADPESRVTQSGISVSNFSVATTYKSKQGDETEWFKVTFFDRLAEVCNQYLAKGSLVYIEGRIKTEKYTDRDGIERYLTKVIGERMQMLGGREDNQQSNNWGSQAKGETATNSYAQAKGRATASSVDELESDMPF
ncbi:single-stranded DNA-binding protein [Oligella urethralis]|uniref:single-stranded DNA-binding protein n=1 Tax=Oligella urethralis TaxID=90245 RepID=UPI0024324CF5|nr:single-stranded DNA-binding protein [Oligella urethralis]